MADGPESQKPAETKNPFSFAFGDVTDLYDKAKKGVTDLMNPKNAPATQENPDARKNTSPEKKNERKNVKNKSRETRESKAHEAEEKKAEKELEEADDANEEAPQLPPTSPQKPPTFMDNVGSFFEGAGEKWSQFMTKASYYFAPIIEALSKLKIPGMESIHSYIDVAMGFLGMQRVMLFGSLKKQKIDPVFNTENPQKDEESIEELTKMADELHAINPSYTLKGFYDSLAIQYANQIKKKGQATFKLEDLVGFARNNVLDGERKYVRDLPKTETPKTPEQPTDVTLTPNGENTVDIQQGSKKKLQLKNKDGALIVNDKKWEVSVAGKSYKIDKLEEKNGALTITVNGMNASLDKTEISSLYEGLLSEKTFAMKKFGMDIEFKV